MTLMKEDEVISSSIYGLVKATSAAQLEKRLSSLGELMNSSLRPIKFAG